MKDEEKTKEQLLQELRKQKIQLRQREQSIIDAVDYAMVLINMRGKITYVNQAFEKLTGYKKEEFVSTKASALIPKLLKSSEDIDKAIKGFNAALKGETPPSEVYTNIVDKNANRIPILATTSFVKDIDGKPDIIIFSAKNITVFKSIEEELKESNHHLKETIAELEATQQQLIQQERISALGQMASGIAHDFNNALATILGYSELLLMAPENLSDKEKVITYLKQINTAAKDASHIVGRLREFYRHSEEDECFINLSLTKLVKQAVELTQPKWKSQAQADNIDINIETSLPPDMTIKGNEVELKEVLINLIFNAVDAMPKGGTINIHGYSDRGYATLEIGDTGYGMTQQVKQHCFEPFFTTKGKQGTGLGLAVVHGIIRRHKGTIDVDSEPGKGAKFIIKLPIPTENWSEEIKQDAKTLEHSLHVLLVDNDSTTRDILKEYLLLDGHTVETSTNGREGLEKFYASRFDVVITNRAMPDVNGVKLASHIKQIAPNKPVILLTGFIGGHPTKDLHQKPADVDFVVNKPVTFDKFRETLRQIDSYQNFS